MKNAFLSILLCSACAMPLYVGAQRDSISDKSQEILSFASSSELRSAEFRRNLTDIHNDSALKSHKIIYFGKGEEPEPDSTSLLIKKFYEDQFRHFQDPLAPYFLFLSKDNKLAMGMGGCVRMRGYFDWGGSIPSPGFAPYLIPMSKDPLRRKYLGTTPAGTALFFRVIGANKSLGDYQLYIEANFNGYQARDFRIKKAYGVINDWTIGYANSTFSDPGALPPAVDASGPNAKMSATSVLIRWLHAFKKGWSMAASVETPSDQIATVEGETAKVQQWIPDVAVFGQFSWNSSDHVRLAAIYRSLPYRNLLSHKNHMVAGWGLQFSGIYHPFRMITLYGAVNGGQGYSSLGGDWLMGNYDLISDPDVKGKMYAPYCYGGYFAIQYNFTPDIFISATYGVSRYHPQKAVDPSDYKSGMYIAANVFWYLTPRISCAAEFNLGRRENQDGESAWARRLGAYVQFSF